MYVLLGIIAAIVWIVLAIVFIQVIRTPIEITYGLSLIFFGLSVAGIYVLFIQNTKKLASSDAKLLAKKYKEITE